jgi:predicted dehydrogenase
MRIALVGCGRWGRNILRDLLALGLEVSVADPDPEARCYAARAGASHLAGDLDELPESGGIVIATPTATHAAVVGRALEGHAPIFVEKPMTNDADDARMLAERSGGRLFVMDKWRYHPGIGELRRLRETRELGQPLGMHLRHVGWGTPQRDVDVSWILLPHCLSIFLEVFGRLPQAKHAFAENLATGTVALNGALGGEPWATIEVSVRSPEKRREFRLHCEGGVAWLDDGWSDHIKIARGADGMGADAPEIERRSVSTELPLMRELRVFVEHLRGGPPPRSSAEEGALIVERIHQLRSLAGVHS